MSLFDEHPLMAAASRQVLLIPFSAQDSANLDRHLQRWQLEYRIIALLGRYGQQERDLLFARLCTHFNNNTSWTSMDLATSRLRRAGLIRCTWWNVVYQRRYNLTRAGWREHGLVAGEALIAHPGALAKRWQRPQ